MNGSSSPVTTRFNPRANIAASPAANLAPLADIIGKRFHIDVSTNEALLVQSETGIEFPLSMLSFVHSDEVREKACDQYVKSVLSGAETIEQDRATLFLVSRFCDQHSQVVIEPTLNTKSRPASRPARSNRSFRKIQP